MKLFTRGETYFLWAEEKVEREDASQVQAAAICDLISKCSSYKGGMQECSSIHLLLFQTVSADKDRILEKFEAVATLNINMHFYCLKETASCVIA